MKLTRKQKIYYLSFFILFFLAFLWHYYQEKQNFKKTQLICNTPKNYNTFLNCWEKKYYEIDNNFIHINKIIEFADIGDLKAQYDLHNQILYSNTNIPISLGKNYIIKCAQKGYDDCMNEYITHYTYYGNMKYDDEIKNIYKNFNRKNSDNLKNKYDEVIKNLNIDKANK